MGYNTESTEWPTGVKVSDATKSVIDNLFNLLDNDSQTVGNRLAIDWRRRSSRAMVGCMVPQGKLMGLKACIPHRLLLLLAEPFCWVDWSRCGGSI
jgi:hypothetical protein